MSINRLQAIRLGEKDQATWIIGFLCLIVYLGCFAFPLMDKDAAHHANIALNMLQLNDYQLLIDRQEDYLDKPHLLFWSSALSFKIFGVNTFAHRLPALLFALLSIFSTYRLTLHLSDKHTARLAAIMLATAQGFVFSINDARMETPLTAGIIFGLWHLIVYIDKRTWLNLILAALGAAIAFSTKGWIGPVIIFVAAFFYLLLQKKWDVLIAVKTWCFIPALLLFISPVLFAYYHQFDLHPEKVIRGMSDISGVKFILWDQNFERFDGDSFKKGGRNSEYFFLYHTFLWAYFPWSILAYVGLGTWLYRLFVKKEWKQPFAFAALAFGFLLFTISWSNFKMPHYIFWFLPLVTLFTAPFIREFMAKKKGANFFYYLHFALALLVLIAALVLNFYFFQPPTLFAWVGGIVLMGALVYLLLKKQTDRALKFVYITAGLSIVFNFMANYSFFPNIYKYQGGNELVKLMKEKDMQIPKENLRLLYTNAHTFDYYLGYNHAITDTAKVPRGDTSITYLVTSPIAKKLREKGYTIDPVLSHVDYNVNAIKFRFLNPKTRNTKLDTLMLAKVY